MNTLQALLHEQTSPLDVLLFIAVTVAFCLIVAAAVYASVLVVLWVLRLRPAISLRRLFLPTGSQFREFAGEYLLATITALLLTATLVAKHDLVEEIRNHPIGDLSTPEVARLFPLEEPPSPLEEQLVLTGAVTTQALLKPVLAAGRAEEAKLFVKALLPKLRDKTLAAHLTRDRLVTAAVILGLLYLLWLGSHRVKELRAVPEGEAAPAYGKTVAGLLVLAVCIALLLATPQLLADDDSLAESTLAAVRSQDVPDPDRAFATALEEDLREQLALFPNLWYLEFSGGVEPENLIEMIAAARRAIRTLSEELERLADREEASSRRHQERLGGLSEQLERLDDRLAGLEAELGQVAQQVRAGLETEQRARREAVDSLDARIAALEGLDRRVESLLTRLEALDRGHGADVESLNRSLDGLANRLADMAALENRLDALERRRPSTGSLVVQVHRSRFGDEFVLTGAERRNFSAPAVLGDLTPGTYQVEGGGYSSQAIRIEAGAVRGVTVGPAPEPDLIGSLQLDDLDTETVESMRSLLVDAARNRGSRDPG